MKLMTTLQKVLVFCCVLSLAVSCKKGDTGPAGPAGPAGTANVIYSDWFTPTSYVKDTVAGSYRFSNNKTVGSITQNVLDSGTVITFGKLNGYNTAIWPSNQVAQLPIAITFINGSVGNVDTWSSLLSPGNLKIQLISSTNAYSGISTSHQFRYIIIPGGVKSTGRMIPGGGFSGMSYAEICSALGIPQ